MFMNVYSVMNATEYDCQYVGTCCVVLQCGIQVALLALK
uniref:Uncharacterized protein n=1 Tax=Anguilla anguilla TaxID=7936 RepID=A0A0E9S9C4_ANGAN